MFNASATLKLASRFADSALPRSSGASILIYHRVGAGTDSRVDLPTREFERQVQFLHEARSLRPIESVTGGVHDQSVVLTFDDGTPDWVDNALPVLEKHHVPATFYVATDYVDAGNPFPSGPAITWNALRELNSSPLVTIGSHTHTHALLDRADGPTTAEELDRSIDRLGEELGIEVEHFAYPKALLGSPAAEAEVRKRFKTAAIAGSRPNVPGKTDLHRLNRTPIQTTDGWKYFVAKADGGMWFEDTVRRTVNKIRYRNAQT